MKIKPCILPFVFGVIVGAMLIYLLTLQQQSTAFDQIPFSERQVLAESFGIAAEKLESGENRFLVDEYIRTAIASQPTSGRWANEIDKIIQTAHSTDQTVFAKNLRLIAKGLQR